MIPLANQKSDLACPVNNYMININGLKLCIQSPGDVFKLEDLFEGGEYSHDWVLRMVSFLPDNVFAFNKLVGHQLTVFVL